MKPQDLRAARQRRGWDQKEAAQRLGVSQPYFSMLERGERPLTPALARKAARVFRLPPTALPVSGLPSSPARNEMQELAEDLAVLGYPGFAYLRGSRRKKNPAEVLLTALAQEDLEPRLAEALPWLLLRYPDVDTSWLVENAKLRDLQNRLGFVVTLARQTAERFEGSATPRVGCLVALEQLLEQSRLAREDTLCQKSLNEVERRWLRENRSEEARHWNLLTGWRSETLRYVA